MRRITLTELLAGRRLDQQTKQRDPEVEYKAEAKRRRKQERNLKLERTRVAA